MSRRIEVELTSARPDGTWTWRAAGAREPKGVVEGELVPASAKVGDVLRVEADIDVDGITITSILPTKGERREPDRLELLGRAEFEPVTSTLVARRERRDRPPRRDRAEGDAERDRRPRRDGPPDRGERPPREHAARTGERPDRGAGERRERPDRGGGKERGERGERRDSANQSARPSRPPRPSRPAPPAKPKPARLRPGRAHRTEVVRSLPAEQQPIAEQALRGGLPAVRQAVEEQNAKLRTEDKPEIKPDGVLSIAEQLLPQLRVAEWLDRAEAARAAIDELDLGDLRSVVVASDDAAVARDGSTRDLAAELKAALARRQDEAHTEWMQELTSALDEGRTVRALRLSSRPPKAGAVFPAELRTRLADATHAALAADVSSDRWIAVLEALAYAPVRSQVKVEQPPAAANDDLRATVTRLASLLPDIARAFSIEPPPPGSRPARPRRGPDARRGRPGPEASKPAPAAQPAAPAEAAPPPEAEAEAADAAEPAPPANAAGAQVAEAQVAEAQVAEAQVADAAPPPDAAEPGPPAEAEPAEAEPAEAERAQAEAVPPAEAEPAEAVPPAEVAGAEPVPPGEPAGADAGPLAEPAPQAAAAEAEADAGPLAEPVPPAEAEPVEAEAVPPAEAEAAGAEAAEPA